MSVTQFKSPEQGRQFQELAKKNKALVAILSALNFGCIKYFGRRIYITEVFRSADSNKGIYGKAKTTPHSVWSAVDFRSHDFSASQQKAIISFLKQFDVFNTWGVMTDSRTVLLHAEGSHGLHFHVQYTGPMPPFTVFRWDEDDERLIAERSRIA